jgi:malate synthase
MRTAIGATAGSLRSFRALSTKAAHAEVGALRVDRQLKRFVDEELLSGTGLDCASTWRGLEKLVVDLMPRSAALLARRDDLQSQIDVWHPEAELWGIPVKKDLFTAQEGPCQEDYVRFLEEINYVSRSATPRTRTTLRSSASVTPRCSSPRPSSSCRLTTSASS